MTERTYDLLAMGRSSIDLYSNDEGSRFPEIRSFGAFVGGCPTNIVVGARRLGMRTALLTAVGDDPVGDFVLEFLAREAVETRYIVRKSGRRTSAVLLGIEPPDRFPLVFYRDGCADVEFGIDDVLAAPITDTRALLITGTGLSCEPCRSATLFAAERAADAGVEVFLDADFRPDQWHDPRAYGVAVRSSLRWLDVVIGTEAELSALAMRDDAEVVIEGARNSEPSVDGNLAAAIDLILGAGPHTVVVKRGAEGSMVHLSSGEVICAEPFDVEVKNVLGAGDAFAAGLIYGHLKGWDWERAASMGNATGAIVVTRQGCANFMPSECEALELFQSREA
ncbi:MAG: 5-dehydro-2-deoxygluconokinase [Gammaproteobacteria bacterium]|nr:5-dehydro-2-deoxygluconokinase [Gammaproteobacteria bacterium]